MDNLKERVAAIVAKVSDLKKTRDAASALVTELNREKDKLPASVTTALSAYGKEKNKK